MVWMFGPLIAAAVVVVFVLINGAIRERDGMDPLTVTVVAALAVATLATIVALLVIV